MSDKIENYFETWGVPSTLRELARRDISHWIDGKAITGSTRIDVFEPSTSTVVAHTFEAGKEHVDDAVRAARRAFRGAWADLRPLDRQALMLRLADLIDENADELAFLESIDVGKSVVLAKEIDIAGSVDTLRHFAGYCTRIEGRTAPMAAYDTGSFGMTIKKPVGIVAAIAPWNFPLQTLIWKCAAAFATGCVVVAKPSEVTPMTALRLGELTAEAGFPPGVFNVVNGTGTLTGAALTSHPDIDKISFTGSTETGTAVGQAGLQSMTRLTLELGGKSAAIVTADADLDVAVEGVVNGIFFNSGQVCDSTSRAVVESSVYDEFMQRLITATQDIKMGPGLDPDTFMGPMVSIEHKAKVAGYVAGAVKAGLSLPVKHSGTDDGQYQRPVIVEECPEENAIWNEEIFGPVLAVRKADGFEALLELANKSEYGLGASIYSSNTNNVMRVAQELNTGTIYVNGHGFLDPNFPFGGVGMSGFGKDLGPEQLDAYLETKSVLFL